MWRELGDAALALSAAALLWDSYDSKVGQGVSLKSLALRAAASFLLVLDDVLSDVSRLAHASVVLATACTAYVVWKGNGKGLRTSDSFPVEVALVVCGVLSLFVHYGQDLVIEEVLWAYSTYLEAIALLPQCTLTSRDQRRSLGSVYLFLLASYNIYVTADWVTRGLHEHHVDYIAAASSTVQWGVYLRYVQLHLSLPPATEPNQYV